MPLSHKEGFAARSSKITPCWEPREACRHAHLSGVVKLLNNDDELSTPIEFWAL